MGWAYWLQGIRIRVVLVYIGTLSGEFYNNIGPLMMS